MWGWLIVTHGHFTWYANLPYLLAILTYKKRVPSLSLSFISLAILVFFLSVVKTTDISGHKDMITGYGWGYFLWISAVVILIIGQLLKSEGENNQRNLNSTIVPLAICSIISLSTFAHYFYFSKTAPYALIKERNETFDRICTQVHEQIYQDIDDVKGFYIDPYLGVYCKVSSSEKSCRYVQSPVSGLIVRNKIFVERKTKEYYEEDTSEYQYVRILPKHVDKQLLKIPTNNLESNYSVVATSLTEDIDSNLNIWAQSIKIHNINTGEVVAESGFVISEIDNKFCGETKNNTYSTLDFITNSLNLK